MDKPTQMDPYLYFDGNCAEAMRFYERTLGGTIRMMMKFSDAPPQENMPAGEGDRIMHVSLDLPGRSLMASDTMPGQPYKGMNGFSLSLSYKTAEEGKRIFDALAEGGSVTMAYGKTFWAEGFGMLSDRYGTPWMVNAGEQSGG